MACADGLFFIHCSRIPNGISFLNSLSTFPFINLFMVKHCCRSLRWYILCYFNVFCSLKSSINGDNITVCIIHASVIHIWLSQHCINRLFKIYAKFIATETKWLCRHAPLYWFSVRFWTDTPELYLVLLNDIVTGIMKMPDDFAVNIAFS